MQVIYKETKGTLFKSSSLGSPLAIHLLKRKSTFKKIFHNKPKRDSEPTNVGLNRIDSPGDIREKKRHCIIINGKGQIIGVLTQNKMPSWLLEIKALKIQA